MLEPNSIKEIFDKIAYRYDLANHILSLGADRFWRKKLVKLASPSPSQKLLDICCGTGDLAIEFARQIPSLEITACDFSPQMLELARQKTKKANVSIIYDRKDCTYLDYNDNTFDIVSCAFGLRNIQNFETTIQKVHRILKPRGKFTILEFSKPESRFLKPFYSFYLHYLLPPIGGIITHRYKDYRYLATSVENWYANVNLTEQLQKNGFNDVQKINISLGIVNAYIAYKG